MVLNGFAFAISDCGSGGYCIKEAIIRTHQLTEYIIDNFHVTGKVYLIGISMGGNVALMLGAKYPDLYAGVLEIAGTKDVEARYNLHYYYSKIADNAALGAAVTANGGENPPFPCPTIDYFRGYCISSVNDVIAECGGTPDKKPQAYDRISAIDSATKIMIPTITIHGTADGLVPYSQSVAFMNAVNAEGYGSLYRLYKVDGGQHCNSACMGQIPAKLTSLIMWAEYKVLPPASSY
jgi:pimeloyl-ACP methyl ester carboxylesterase